MLYVCVVVSSVHSSVHTAMPETIEEEEKVDMTSGGGDDAEMTEDEWKGMREILKKV